MQLVFGVIDDEHRQPGDIARARARRGQRDAEVAERLPDLRSKVRLQLLRFVLSALPGEQDESGTRRDHGDMRVAVGHRVVQADGVEQREGPRGRGCGGL